MNHEKVRVKFRKAILVPFILSFLFGVGLLSGLSQAAVVKPAGSVTVVGRCGRGLLLDVSGQRVLLVAGSAYDIGYQHGRLLKVEVQRTVKIALSLARGSEKAREKGYLPGTLENAFERTRKFIDLRYHEEMRGLADGAGIALKDVQLANIFPELFHCSGFAVFGKATADGQLLHGRILDYTTNAGFQESAVVVVVKPDGFNSFITVGYAGLLGSVTGMNDKQIAIGEIGGRGEGNWDGMPMTFLLRKAIEEADTLEKAVNIFKNSRRTCEYYYVISDGKIPDARGLACTPEKCEVISPGQSYPHLPHAIDDALLMGAGYQPLVVLTKKQYGQIDVPAALDFMNRPVAMKRCLHRVLFTPTNSKLWVSNAVSADVENHQAYEQPYYHYNFKELSAMIPDAVEAASP